MKFLSPTPLPVTRSLTRLGQAISLARRRRHLTQEDLAERIGASVHTVRRLAPAFDLNPFPDKESESKTWLSEDSGPITSVAQLLDQAARFELSVPQAQAILEEMSSAIKRWKTVATTAQVGLQAHELNDFKPAFKSVIP